MQAYLIDPVARAVTEVTYEQAGENTLQSHLGGWITTAGEWRTGEVLYVDDEGLMKPQLGFFRIAAIRTDDQPLAGRGIVVGRELIDDEGNYLGTAPPSFSVEWLTSQIEFLTRGQADAWGKANASDPMTAMYTITDDGAVHREVLSHTGPTFASIPIPKPEELTRPMALFVLGNWQGFEDAMIHDAGVIIMMDTESTSAERSMATMAVVGAAQRRSKAARKNTPKRS